MMIWITIFVILAGAPVFACIDSPWLAEHFAYGQSLDNMIMVLTYSWVLLISNKRLYWLMLLMTICSLGAETIGSLILTVYRYRLHNIPMYIPLGHAVIYATVYQICRQPLIWSYHKNIETWLTKSAFVASFLSLFLLKDIAGFLCYLFFLGIIRFVKKPLFYLCMFTVVYYIELCGTLFETWSWYGVLGNHPLYPSIGRTPSGMASLYILIDLVSNFSYITGLKGARFYYYLIIKKPRYRLLSNVE